MERFLAPDADPVALSRALAPRPGDAARVFTGDFVALAEAHYQQHLPALAPTPPQTELLMWKVRAEELRDGTGDAAKCDSRYRALGTSLAPNVRWHCFRFVVPGQKEGTSSEGLVFVNGHWALFPAPWTATP